jgi:hypothetical protein
MAKVNPLTVYFPEPNTIVRVLPDKDTIEAHFTSKDGGSENQALVASLRNRRNLASKNVVFNLDAAIETNSDRFTVKIGKKEVQININWAGGKIPQLTAEHIEALFNSSQVHAQKIYWIRRVMSQYQGGHPTLKGRGDAITDVYEHYFPNELIGYEPEELKKNLKTYTRMSNYGEGALRPSTENEPSTKENLQSTGDYDAVISIAKESGQAVQNFLLEVLGIE